MLVGVVVDAVGVVINHIVLLLHDVLVGALPAVGALAVVVARAAIVVALARAAAAVAALVHHLDDVRRVAVEALGVGAELTALFAVVLLHLDVVVVDVAHLMRAVHLARVHAERRVAVKVRRRLVAVVRVALVARRRRRAARTVRARHLDRDLGQVLERAQHALDERLDARQRGLEVRERAGEHRDKVFLEHRLGHVQDDLGAPRRVCAAVRLRGEQAVAHVCERVQPAVAHLEHVGAARRRRVAQRLAQRVEQRLAHADERLGHRGRLDGRLRVRRERDERAHCPVRHGHALTQRVADVVREEASRDELGEEVGERWRAAHVLLEEGVLGRVVRRQQLAQRLQQEEDVRCGVLTGELGQHRRDDRAGRGRAGIVRGGRRVLAQAHVRLLAVHLGELDLRGGRVNKHVWIAQRRVPDALDQRADVRDPRHRVRAIPCAHLARHVRRERRAFEHVPHDHHREARAARDARRVRGAQRAQQRGDAWRRKRGGTCCVARRQHGDAVHGGERLWCVLGGEQCEQRRDERAIDLGHVRRARRVAGLHLGHRPEAQHAREREQRGREPRGLLARVRRVRDPLHEAAAERGELVPRQLALHALGCEEQRDEVQTRAERRARVGVCARAHGRKERARLCRVRREHPKHGARVEHERGVRVGQREEPREKVRAKGIARRVERALFGRRRRLGRRRRVGRKRRDDGVERVAEILRCPGRAARRVAGRAAAFRACRVRRLVRLVLQRRVPQDVLGRRAHIVVAPLKRTPRRAAWEAHLDKLRHARLVDLRRRRPHRRQRRDRRQRHRHRLGAARRGLLAVCMQHRTQRLRRRTHDAKRQRTEVRRVPQRLQCAEHRRPQADQQRVRLERALLARELRRRGRIEQRARLHEPQRNVEQRMQTRRGVRCIARLVAGRVASAASRDAALGTRRERMHGSGPRRDAAVRVPCAEHERVRKCAALFVEQIAQHARHVRLQREAVRLGGRTECAEHRHQLLCGVFGSAPRCGLGAAARRHEPHDGGEQRVQRRGQLRREVVDGTEVGCVAGRGLAGRGLAGRHARAADKLGRLDRLVRLDRDARRRAALRLWPARAQAQCGVHRRAKEDAELGKRQRAVCAKRLEERL